MLFFFLLVQTTISAKHADNFMIGNYSYWRAYGIHQTAADSVLQRMKDCGYNATICDVYNSDGETAIRNMLDKFDMYEQDAILTDFTWDALQTNSKYGVHGFCESNYQVYEAEYSDEFNVRHNDRIDDNFYYSSRIIDSCDTLRVGEVFQLPDKSNLNVWRCIQGTHQPGYAYKNLTYRWKKEGNSIFDRLSEEFQFTKIHWDTTLTNYMMSNYYVDFTFALQVPAFDRDIANPINLLTFELCGYNWNNEFKKIPHINNEAGEIGEVTVLTQYEYDDIIRTDGYDNKLITLRVSLLTLKNLGFLSPDDAYSGRYVLSDVNPRLYWYGNSTLHLDYVQVEDNIHKFMVENQTYFTQRLNDRITQLREWSPGNIKYMYGFDEPNQAQCDSYRKVEDAISSGNPTVITAVYDFRRDMLKSDASDPIDKYYQHQLSFVKRAEPKILSPDLYPINPEVDWNTETSSHFLQTVCADNLLSKYAKYKSACDSLNIQFTPIVQSFGAWCLVEGTYQWVSWLRPPKETQKILQLLPLCYGANGIINFLFPTFNDSISNRNLYGALSIRGNGSIFEPLSNYYALQEANYKIKSYVSYLNGCVWKGTDSLRVNNSQNGLPLSSLMMQSIMIQPSSGKYQGYVQCGGFLNGNLPFFMLVNRRANYVRAGYNPVFTNNENLDSCFESALPQNIQFIPNADAYTCFGTSIALHDPFDDVLYRTPYPSIDVPIEPGDGKLLEIVGTLPNTVTSNSLLSQKAILEGNVIIESGAVVSVTSGTHTRIKSDAIVNVSNGAILILRGNVVIEDSVRIVVAPNGALNFDNATCTWGQGSKIEVTGGTLSINGGSMNASSPSRWAGIRATESSQVTINNASISGAFSNVITDSNCLITDSSISVPANSVGLILENSNPGHQTNIINTLPNRGFYGTTNLNTVGIGLGKIHNQANICNVDFQNLYSGIIKHAVPYANDTVSECRFVNCATGIKLFNNENGTSIQQCSFTNTQTGKQGTGIHLVASSPTIATSNFHNLYRGILTEFAIIGSNGLESSITESNFYNCEMGMESRSAYHCLKANYFNRNNSGIVNHAGSNLNLSFDANNVMMNRGSNIVFYDTMPYESTIQLFVGHNDFYHLEDNETLISAVDFSFDANYYNSSATHHKIEASKNWFQDFQVYVNDHDYQDYVYVTAFDLSPSMPAPPPENDRLFIALDHESQELYELAGATYKAIIDEQLEEEQTYVTSAIDGLYRCTMMIPNPDWELADYFDTKAVLYAIDEPALSAILKDYLAKVFVLNKDFQAAVDLIQLRIDNPISEIDSLRAVLDLEIVLQLAAMEEDKRPLTTKYVQYQYPDFQVFDVMHSNNWDKYSRLLHQNDPQTTSLIAPIPQIQSNYPNPFNPSTTIEFSIPATGRTRVSIYNIKGQKVKDLINTELARGNHKLIWDGNDAHNRHVASGIYLLYLESGGRTSIRKAMLMK